MDFFNFIFSITQISSDIILNQKMSQAALHEQQYIPKVITMQFSDINKYESLVQKYLKPSYQPYQPMTYDIEVFPKQNFQEILSNIQQINLSRSFHVHRIDEGQNTMSSSKVKSNVSSEDTISCDIDAQTFHSQRKISKRHTGKSLIFTNQSFSKAKEKQRSERSIKVYYFNLPTWKSIEYDKSTTIEHLINLSINAYLQDKQLDPSRFQDKSFKSYEMRLLKDDQNHEADLKIQPIGYNRLIIDNIFDSLVLLPKTRSERTPTKAQNIQATSVLNINKSNIQVFNQLGQELGRIEINKNDLLEKIFDYIEMNDLHQMRNYYLTENRNDIDGLPKDFQIKNLESTKIYIKSKRFIDESQFDSHSKIIRSLTICKQKQEVFEQTLPIGLNEASRYQEFSVIKVNNMGVEQERIMGIDQTKVYNYDKMVKQEKKQTSFLSKIFGVNQTTGTKRPYRFISDILEVKKIQRGLAIAFKEKTIKYYVDSSQTKQKIFRKLNFLINLSEAQRKNEKNKF